MTKPNKNKHARKGKGRGPGNGRCRTPGLGCMGRYTQPAYEDIDLGSLSMLDEGGASTPTTPKKPEPKKTTWTDDRHCDVCGDKFNSYKKGIKKTPKTLRKEHYAYCSTECINIANRGLIET